MCTDRHAGPTMGLARMIQAAQKFFKKKLNE